MRFMQLHAFYEWYLDIFYARRPGLENRPYKEQMAALIDDGFAATHMRTPYLPALGYECELVIGNCNRAQARWAEEHGLPRPETPLDYANLVLRQIDHFRPDILYIGESIIYSSHYIRALPQRPPLVVGWRAAIIPPSTDWSEFDLILSSDEDCLRTALKQGAKASRMFLPHVPAFTARAVADQPKLFDVVFCGQISASHAKRLQVLNDIAKASIGGTRKGFTPAFFLASGDPRQLPAGVRMHDKGPVWSMDMLRAIRSGRISVNVHIDLAAHKSLNMRTYEVLSAGSFLLTEATDVLHEFFTPGRELVTYDGADDLIEKIYYYLDHEDEREEIARRGQERCLTEYSAEKGAVEFDAVLRQAMAKKNDRSAPVSSGRKPLKVDLVNAWETEGGAAQAANRLFKALRTIGVDAEMLVYIRNTEEPFVRTIDEAKASPIAKAHIQHQMQDDLAKYGANFQKVGVFGLDRADKGVALLSSLDPNADIVNLHWVGNLIDWELFFRPGRVTAPVVWTMHDMRPFTGGCHYSGECENYRTGCGYCRFFGADRLEDLSRIAFARQKAALNGWNGRLHVVTPSHWLAREAASSPIMANLPITVIPNSIDLTLFQARDKAEARARLNLPGNVRILLFIAHMLTDPRKGGEYLLQALPALRDIPDFQLLTVGLAPPVWPEGIRVVNAGNVTDQLVLNHLYAAADLVVLPTLQDNLPNIILEAFASGTPIAGFATGGVPDHVIEGETGFLVPARNGAALTKTLHTALSDMPRLAQMGRTCRAHAEREFGQLVQAERYRALFERLLDQSSA